MRKHSQILESFQNEYTSPQCILLQGNNVCIYVIEANVSMYIATITVKALYNIYIYISSYIIHNIKYISRIFGKGNVITKIPQFAVSYGMSIV